MIRLHLLLTVLAGMFTASEDDVQLERYLLVPDGAGPRMRIKLADKMGLELPDWGDRLYWDVARQELVAHFSDAAATRGLELQQRADPMHLAQVVTDHEVMGWRRKGT